MSKSKQLLSAPSLTLSSEYSELLATLKERVRSAQYAALRVVNSELVSLYWDIGRELVERQRDTSHGVAIAEQLARDLRAEFPGIAGFRGATSSICGSSTCCTRTRRECNRWLHKSPGPTIW
nr:DUF1016 N-terminal domain-containing protein [Roseateles oligotrophus]